MYLISSLSSFICVIVRRTPESTRTDTVFPYNDALPIYLVQARRAMGHGVLAHLDPDPAPPHLVRHRRGGAGAEKRVEHKIAGVRGDVKDTLDETFWFWSSEDIVTSE